MQRLSICVVLGVLVSTAPSQRKGSPPRPPPKSRKIPTTGRCTTATCIGTRHNPGEKTLGKDNVAQLVEKWRFPPADSQGEDRRRPRHGRRQRLRLLRHRNDPDLLQADARRQGEVVVPATRGRSNRVTADGSQFGLPTAGFLNAALVTSDTVYVGDIGGTIYALDRATGKERWKIDTRATPFPGAHPSNCIFAVADPGRRQRSSRRRRLRARRRRRPEEPRLHRPRLRRRPGAGHRQGGLEVRRRPRAARRSTRRSRSRTPGASARLPLRPLDQLGLVYAVVRRRDAHDLLRHRLPQLAAPADHGRPAGCTRSTPARSSPWTPAPARRSG